MENSGSNERNYHAMPVSPGIAIGRVFPFRRLVDYTEAPEKRKIELSEIESETERFLSALEKTREDLSMMQRQLRDKLQSDAAGIFEAHILIVDDSSMIDEVKALIRTKHLNADYAFHQVIERYYNVLHNMPDEYLRERSIDIRDVGARVKAHLTDHIAVGLDQLSDRRIIVATDLTPSETVLLDPDKVLGFAIESGSASSHSAILARSMQIPAVTGLPKELLENLTDNDKMIIDGFTGRIIINPDPRTEEAYSLKAEETGKLFSDLQSENTLTPETADGFMVQLAANVERAVDIKGMDFSGASGVGLYRTEYLFLNQPVIPSEEEQFEEYTSVLAENDRHPVIIRTLDVGGDKNSRHIYHSYEENPFLGLRGVRLCLGARQDIFRTQLRALLRAGVIGDLKVMIPMVTCVEEVIEVKKIIEEIQEDLDKEKIPYLENLPLGIMIETPAAALQAEVLAKHVDFFSIGTNDLVQYTMATDRNNKSVAYLYRPSHPAILELIARCITAARANDIWVSVCGQMASEPQFTPILVGLGVHELSMNPNSIAPIRRVIRKMKMHEAESAAMAALNSSKASEALDYSIELLERVAPEVAELIVDSERMFKC